MAVLKNLQGADASGIIADDALDVLLRLERILGEDLLDILTRLNTGDGTNELEKLQAQTKAQVILQIRKRLGIELEQVNAILSNAALESVRAVIGDTPANLNMEFKEELDAIVSMATDNTTKVFKEASESMRDAVAQGILRGGPLTNVIREVQSNLKTTYLRAQSSVDTATMAVGRRAVFQSAQESGIPNLVYVYVGPKDIKNRPFCKLWAGKACTDPSKLDNGQQLPVEDYCGGYNCRHSWAPTQLKTAIADGYEILLPSGAPALITQESDFPEVK